MNLYGIYPAVCKDVADPQKRRRIRVKCPQVYGNNMSNWAEACLPVTDNADHPDHMPHTGAQIAALLNNHSGTFTDSNGETVTVTFSHTGTSGTLLHPHVPYNDPQDEGGPEEHTIHREVPRLGQVVWVMFQGGDPNYPVWIGVGV